MRNAETGEESPPILRFGDFALDLHTGELSRDGERVTLRPQATEVLLLLARGRGRLVTRAEIQERVWHDSTVEFDQGINACIRQIRQALDDDAASPRWIETIPRRGYRFIGPERPAADEASVARTPRRLVLLIAAGLLLLATAAWMVRTRGAALDDRIAVAVRVVPHNRAIADQALPAELGAALVSALAALDTARVQIVPWRWETRWDRDTRLLYDGDRAVVLDYIVLANLSSTSDSVHVSIHVERIGGSIPVWYWMTTMPYAERERGFHELAEGVMSAFQENLLAREADGRR